MGGNAFVIYGNFTDDPLRPRPARRSMMDRLLGRVPTEVPTWVQHGRDLRMIDLPSEALKGFGEAFRDHAASRFKSPWAATASVLDYLRIGVISVHVRGASTGNNPPEWYVQLTFSGCAGMAEVSSDLAAHWGERWYRAEEAALVTRFLRPYGFEPNGRIEPDRSTAVFVPLGTAGYALYSATPRELDEEDVESRHFEIDVAHLETLDESERPRLLRKLDEELPPLLPASSCCCQWCDPAFDVAAVDRVIPFRD